jgi:amidohydrolase
VLSLALLSCCPSASLGVPYQVGISSMRTMLAATGASFLLLAQRPMVSQAAPFTIRHGDDEVGGTAMTNSNMTKGDACVEDGFPLFVSQEFDSVLKSMPQSSSLGGSKGSRKKVSANNMRNSVVDGFFDYITGPDNLREEIQSLSMELKPLLIKARRTLHQYPELMYGEEKTSFILQHVLTELGIPFTTGWAKNTHLDAHDGRPGGYGIVVEFGKAEESSAQSSHLKNGTRLKSSDDSPASTDTTPCVLLRGDMDGLPIGEETPHEANTVTSSQHTGRMHACGHDAHMTMLLGATVLLHRMEGSLKEMGGVVRIMFQPAEEGGAGAKRMVEEGVLSMDPPVQAAFGMHVWPALPSGTIGGRPGSLLAASDMFEIVVTGVGGHAAMPHQTTDPVPAVAAMTLSLQTLVARELSPLEPGVVSVTQVDTGGNAFNVIPAKVKIGGTIRALTTDTLLKLRDRLKDVVTHTARAHGCTVTIEYMQDYYPPTVNDPELYDFASQVASPLSQDNTVVEVEPTMGAEDFAFLAQEVPSVFFVIGQGSGTSSGPPTSYGLHHPHFNLDEDVLTTGVQLHVNLALQTLQRLREKQMEETS